MTPIGTLSRMLRKRCSLAAQGRLGALALADLALQVGGALAHRALDAPRAAGHRQQQRAEHRRRQQADQREQPGVAVARVGHVLGAGRHPQVPLPAGEGDTAARAPGRSARRSQPARPASRRRVARGRRRRRTARGRPAPCRPGSPARRPWRSVTKTTPRKAARRSAGVGDLVVVDRLVDDDADLRVAAALLRQAKAGGRGRPAGLGRRQDRRPRRRHRHRVDAEGGRVALERLDVADRDDVAAFDPGLRRQPVDRGRRRRGRAVRPVEDAVGRVAVGAGPRLEGGDVVRGAPARSSPSPGPRRCRASSRWRRASRRGSAAG